jgi:hypothetical protein
MPLSPIHLFVILTLAVATFSRALEAGLGLPRAVNWLHFPMVGALFLVSLRRVRPPARPFYAALIALLAVFVVSGLVNRAGAVNVVAGYALLAEPFLLLAVLVNTRASRRSVEILGWSLLLLIVAQIPIALYQWFFLAAGNPDRVQGTFTGMGAGHHVLGALSLITALSLLRDFTLRPRWLEWPLAALLLALVVLSDSKQPLLALFLAFVALRGSRVRSAAQAARLAGQTAMLLLAIYAAQRWFGSDRYFHMAGTVALGFANKFTVFPLLIERFETPMQWLTGIGPGHGVSRMGGWLLEHYWNVLEPLGATRTDVAEAAWRASQPYEKLSSFFATLTSWAGIFGDLGLAGLFVYARLVWLTYRRLCLDDLSRLILLGVVLLGLFFEWLEEYNFMLIVLSLLAQRWLAQGDREETPGSRQTSGSA